MIYIYIIILTLVFSAIFSGVEIAFISSNKLHFELGASKGNINARIVSYFNKNSSKFFVTMLIGNNIALVIYGIFVAKLLEKYIIKIFPYLNNFNVFALQTFISTIIILVFAEFLPKAISRLYSIKLMEIFSVPIFILYVLLFPVVYLTTVISEFVIKVFTKKDLDRKYNMIFSINDIGNYLMEVDKQTKDNENINNELQMFQNFIDFSDLKVRDCIVPRTDIIAVKDNESIKVVYDKFIESGKSRLIVYNDSIDNVTGFIHIYDLFKHPENISQIIRNIVIVPETMPAKKLLRQFIETNNNIALVVDEFGGTAGIVTLEDIIEEIFGNIEDEYDTNELILKQINNNVYVFSGKAEVSDINERFKLNIPDENDYKTIAGYILYKIQNIPIQGQEFTIDGFKVKILKVKKNAIELIKISKITNE